LFVKYLLRMEPIVYQTRSRVKKDALFFSEVEMSKRQALLDREQKEYIVEQATRLSNICNSTKGVIRKVHIEKLHNLLEQHEFLNVYIYL